MPVPTFTYSFTANGQSDVVVVTVAASTTSSTPYGPGYNVTAISGTIGGAAISGEVGTGGKVQYTGNSGGFDNTIFPSGVSGAQGSYYGIDGLGIEFTVGSTSYNLYSTGASALHLYSPSAHANVTLTSTDAPCYCPGTLIATPHGDRPIETLAQGDLVLTADGEALPVTWLGRRSYSGRFLAGRRELLPICFQAGALGDGLPRRDLFVSPEHAMLLDGMLIPARLLVNGTTIVRMPQAEAVHYLHLELERHVAVLAEGAAAESYADDDDSYRFHNAADRPARAETVRLCAPRVESGFQLEAVRARLAGAAGQVALAA